MNGNDLIKGFGIGQGLVNNTITNATRLAGLREWQQEQQDRAALRNALGGIPQDLSPLQQSNAQLNVLAQHYAATGKHADLLAIHKIRNESQQFVQSTIEGAFDLRRKIKDPEAWGKTFQGIQAMLPEVFGNWSADMFENTDDEGVIVRHPETKEELGVAYGNKFISTKAKDESKHVSNVEIGGSIVSGTVDNKGEITPYTIGGKPTIAPRYKEGSGSSEKDAEKKADKIAKKKKEAADNIAKIRQNYRKIRDAAMEEKDLNKRTQILLELESETQEAVRAHNEYYGDVGSKIPKWETPVTDWDKAGRPDTKKWEAERAKKQSAKAQPAKEQASNPQIVKTSKDGKFSMLSDGTIINQNGQKVDEYGRVIK